MRELDKSHPGGATLDAHSLRKEEDNTNRLRQFPARCCCTCMDNHSQDVKIQRAAAYVGGTTNTLGLQMGYISPLFSLLGEWVPQLSLSFSPPRRRSGSPIHVQFDREPQNTTQVIPAWRHESLTTLPEPRPAISHIRHPEDLEKTGRFLSVCRIECPSIPIPIPIPITPPPPYYGRIFLFLMRFLQIACWETLRDYESVCLYAGYRNGG
ncbi:hypothetical protein F5Y06DRAFT_117307 [Hypoxylon sp. FL0890]|nr:hypothetical protein F5Y06DRAFT_117307 [Hypoxylon sp. FL0890]